MFVPVKDRKGTPHVFIEMRWIDRMMDLMMRRADEQAPEDAGEGDPELRVLQL